MNLQNVYDYCQDNNIDIFEGCTTPAPIDVDLLKSYIMLRCGLLTPVYAEPLLLKMQIKMWFDSQLLTRSTCLIGCMLIILKERKYIEFIKDEMPDWKSIGMGTFEGTYITGEDIDVLDVDIKDIKGVHPFFKIVLNFL